MIGMLTSTNILHIVRKYFVNKQGNLTAELSRRPITARYPPTFRN